jgi:CheY-like chemotaxis protein
MPAVDRRILIVDDNSDAGELTAELLRLHGADALYVATGEEALRIAPTFLPHTVFLDINMPSMDGFAVLAAMLKIPHVGLARYVALTAWSHAEMIERLLNAGFARHISKPASLENLLRELQEQ